MKDIRIRLMKDIRIRLINLHQKYKVTIYMILLGFGL